MGGRCGVGGRSMAGGFCAQSSPLPRPPWSRTAPCGWGALSGGASFTPAPGPLLPVSTCAQFDPELVLISAGFDSAIGDPEVRAWPGWGGLLGSRARPPSHLALVPGADAGHAQVLRPPHAAAAGAGRRPRLCCAGGDCGSREGSPARCGGAVGGGLLCRVGRPVWDGGAPPHCQPCLVESLPCPCSQGGYHLESLSQSVCMVVKALLGDPAPPLSGPMVPQHRYGGRRLGRAGGLRPGLTAPASPYSALESIQSARAAQAPHWTSLRQQGQCGPSWAAGSGSHAVALTLSHPLGSSPILSSSTWSPEERPSPVSPGGPKFEAAEAQTSAVLSSLLDQLHLHPTPPVRTAVALTALDAALVLPPEVLLQEGSAPQEETQAWARWAERAWGEGWGYVCTCAMVTVSLPVHMSLWFPIAGYTRPWPRTRLSLHLERSCIY